MKKNIFFKAQLTGQTDEETLYNTFPLYVIAVLEIFFLVLLQGEFNTLSIILLCIGLTIACTAAYKVGSNSGR